jgi:hypothetical protein
MEVQLSKTHSTNLEHFKEEVLKLWCSGWTTPCTSRNWWSQCPNSSGSKGSPTTVPCSRQRSWVLPGLRDSRNKFGGMGVARGVTEANTGSGPPSVEEGRSGDPEAMEET